MKKFLVVIALLALATTAAAAQTIGTLPDKSPFLDLHDGQRFGLVVGFLATGHDAVGVQQKSAPAYGVRYDLAVGGPAYLTGEIFASRSTRTIYDYTKSAATRNLTSQTTGLINANIGLGLSLTGTRSWHKLQPLVNVGVGIVGGLGDKADISGYQIRPAFSFSLGVGARYVTGKNSELRADAGFYFWSLKYPDSYRSTQGDAIAIRPTGALDSFTTNGLITIGWTLRSFR